VIKLLLHTLTLLDVHVFNLVVLATKSGFSFNLSSSVLCLLFFAAFRASLHNVLGQLKPSEVFWPARDIKAEFKPHLWRKSDEIVQVI
jgi:hypothetical protein